MNQPTSEKSSEIKLPENFNPGIIQPLKRKQIWKTLLLSIVPGLGHVYTDQKKLALFFFLSGALVYFLTFQYQWFYLLYGFEAVLFLSAIQSTRSYLFRKRYVYLAGVHGWEYRSW